MFAILARAFVNVITGTLPTTAYQYQRDAKRSLNAKRFMASPKCLRLVYDRYIAMYKCLVEILNESCSKMLFVSIYIYYIKIFVYLFLFYWIKALSVQSNHYRVWDIG